MAINVSESVTLAQIVALVTLIGYVTSGILTLTSPPEKTFISGTSKNDEFNCTSILFFIVFSV
jgi:hypothetical protein